MRWIIFLLVFVALLPQTCRGAADGAGEHHLLLDVGGEGYGAGDIVEVSPETSELAVGDVVLFDMSKNRSGCMYMGPGEMLVRIIALPGEPFQFTAGGVQVRGTDTPVANLRLPLIIGQTTYATFPTDTLTVPQGEYLVNWVTGMECTGRDADGFATSPAFWRTTVRQEAIIGKVLRKVGHDDTVADEAEQRVY